MTSFLLSGNLLAACVPAPCAVGFLHGRNEQSDGRDDDRRRMKSERFSANGYSNDAADQHHDIGGDDSPPFPGGGRGAVTKSLRFEPEPVGHRSIPRCLPARSRSASAPPPRTPSAVAAARP